MMKKLLLLCMPLLLIGGISAQNLVLNGGFDTWTSDTQPESWLTAANITKESTIFHSGSYSAMQTSGASSVKMNQEIAVEAGKTYTISYWYFDNDVNAKARCWSYWLDASGASLTDNVTELRPTTYSEDSPDWKQFTFTLVAPATATALRFEVRTYKGTVEGGFVYFDDFSVTTSGGGGASTAADILSFAVTNQQGTSVIDAINQTVLVTMPQGTNVSALSPTISVSANATINPASGVSQDFTNPVVYTVTAEDGTTSIDWIVTVEVATELQLLNENFESTIDKTDVALAGWTNFKELGTRAWQGRLFSANRYAQATSYGSAEANTSWLITPVIDLSKTIDEVFSFNVNVGYWNHNGLTVLISEDFNGTDVLAATWVDITSNFVIPTTPTSGYGLFAPAGELSLADYTSKVAIAFKYTGDANQTQTTTYQIDEVKIVAKPNYVPSSETDITSFSFAEQTGPTLIYKDLHKITVEVANGAGITSLVPTIEVSAGASVNPVSGVAQNFSSEVVYTVTAEDGSTTQDWTVTVSVAAQLSSAAEIMTFSLDQEVEPALINTESATVTSLVNWDADLTSLTPSITFSFGAQISPTTWETIHDFSLPVKYDVTAQDGITIKKWTVTVTKDAPPSTEAEITAFELPQLAAPVVINSENATITGEVVYGTNLVGLNPIITVSDGATITPSGAQDFSGPVVYTVIAEDGTTQKTWNVTLTVKALEITSIYNIQYTTDASGASPLVGKTVKTKGVVTGKDSKSICIQDGVGEWNGIYIYKGATIDAVVGDSVTVEGIVSEYKNLTEIGSPVITILNSNNAIPDAVVVSNLSFNRENYESVIVEINNVTCSAEVSGTGNWNVIDQELNAVIVRNQFYSFTPSLGQNFTSITGIGTQYNADFQLQPRSEADILVNSVSDLGLTQITVSPNPFTNQLNIDNLKGISNISISNILGQNLIHLPVNQGSCTINTSELRKGIYIITFEGLAGEKHSERIVKQ